MAQTKMHAEIMGKLDLILAKLGDEDEAAPKTAKVTKAQLMEIKGVGEATADEVLKLLKG